MKKNILAVLIAAALCLGLLPVTAFADPVPEDIWTNYAAESFNAGSGTVEDPYQIATAEQLAKLANDVNGGISYDNTYFVLTSDIDLSAHRWKPIGISIWYDTGATTEKWFAGSFDGGNHVISGMYVDESADKNSAGLFGCIQTGTNVGVKNLVISNATIYTCDSGLMECYAGILVGFVSGNRDHPISFENITVSGSITTDSYTGYNNVGGMIGYAAWANVTNCHAENITITGSSNTGGFVGNDGGSTYTGCSASGTLNGSWSQGGFVGYTTGFYAEPSVFTNCFANVDVNGYDWRLGGFAGFTESGVFINCFCIGDVTSTVTGFNPKVGGFFGEVGNSVDQTNNVTATNCHSAGVVTSISSEYAAGGFAGTCVSGSFSDCSYDIEKNSGLSAAGDGNTDQSGITGESTETVLATICEDYYGGHLYGTEWVVDVAPTCSTLGNQCHVCVRCGAKTDNTPIPTIPHTPAVKNVIPATCELDGNAGDLYCSVCGQLLSTNNIIPKLGHSFLDGKCVVCGAIDPSYVSPDAPDEGEEIVIEEPVEGGISLTTTDSVSGTSSDKAVITLIAIALISAAAVVVGKVRA